MEAGGFVHLPAGMPHALKTESDSIVLQISGTGPFGMEYVQCFGRSAPSEIIV